MWGSFTGKIMYKIELSPQVALLVKHYAANNACTPEEALDLIVYQGAIRYLLKKGEHDLEIIEEWLNRRFPTQVNDNVIDYLHEWWGYVRVEEIDHLTACSLLENARADPFWVYDQLLWNAYAALWGLPTWDKITLDEASKLHKKNNNDPIVVEKEKKDE
jgi:hypothetical protein